MSDRRWFEAALPRYFAGDLDRVESGRFDRLLESSAQAQRQFNEVWDERTRRLGVLVLQPPETSVADCFSFDTLHRFASDRLPADETELVRSHLGCALCRCQVDALSPRDSTTWPAFRAMWRALLSRWRTTLLVAIPVAALMAVFVLPPSDPSVKARGTSLSFDQAVNTTLYVGGRDLGHASSLSRDARVRLRYTNASDATLFLSMFAVDEAGSVFWYYPAWQDAATNPIAVPVLANSRGVMMDEEVVHDLRPGKLRFVSIFTKSRPSVRDVEDAITKWRQKGGRIGQSGPMELVPGGVERTLVVEIE